MAKKKQHSASNSSSEDSTTTAVVSEIAVVQPRAASSGGVDAGAFVGQWQRLVSTTNWDKGRIICQWRATP